MFKQCNIILVLCVLGFAVPASAVELKVSAEKVWWQYQEYAKDAAIAATQASFLPSKSQGQGAALKLGLSSERDETWFFALSGSWMDSTAEATEYWRTKQINDIRMNQLDIRADVQYEVMPHARLGLWLAGRKQEQERQNFVVNGVPTVVSGEPIVETITSTWLGLSFVGYGGNQQQLEASIDVAVPLQVEVTNPLFVNAFSKKTGYRTALKFRWNLPKSEVGFEGLNMVLDYQYQELGGEKQNDGSFWPYNRWQTLGFGLLYAW